MNTKIISKQISADLLTPVLALLKIKYPSHIETVFIKRKDKDMLA
jgi:hypothetical protein